MNALELLKADHDSVKDLLEELEATSEDDRGKREELFARIRRDVEVHEAIEEEVFYPALKDHPKAREVVLEGYEEHHVVDTLMGEMSGLAVTDETWQAKMAVMKENIEHHIEEEEGEMFEEAQQILEAAELDALGDRMRARKGQLEEA